MNGGEANEGRENQGGLRLPTPQSRKLWQNGALDERVHKTEVWAGPEAKEEAAWGASSAEVGMRGMRRLGLARWRK